MRSRTSRNGLSEEEFFDIFYLLDVLTSQKRENVRTSFPFTEKRKKRCPSKMDVFHRRAALRSYNRCFSGIKIVDEWIEDQHCCDDVSGEVIVVGAARCTRMLMKQSCPFRLTAWSYQAVVSSPSGGNVSFPISTVEQHSSDVRRSFSLGRRFFFFFPNLITTVNNVQAFGALRPSVWWLADLFLMSSKIQCSRLSSRLSSDQSGASRDAHATESTLPDPRLTSTTVSWCNQSPYVSRIYFGSNPPVHPRWWIGRKRRSDSTSTTTGPEPTEDLTRTMEQMNRSCRPSTHAIVSVPL